MALYIAAGMLIFWLVAVLIIALALARSAGRADEAMRRHRAR